MSRSKLIFLAILYLTCYCNGASLVGVESSEMDVMVRRVCTKSIGECLEETEMDSEINRRVLVMQKKYISYETLKRDMVPCAKPGASYYNCQGGQANPYNRGCEVITRCARNIRS